MAARDSVSAAYDAIADAWQDARARGPFRERALVDRFVATLPPRGRVLDLGCGSGEPITRLLAEAGFEVVGVDDAPRLLELARRAVPKATFLLGDMRTIELDGAFDAIVAWDSVFHIPRDDHAAMFSRLARWLVPGGRLLLSLGGTGEAGFTSAMYGVTFFYSGHEPEQALALLRDAGFRIEHWEVDDATSRGHIAVFAVRDDALADA
jgi:cyclopropane fatty-acyl-phospholipid synthase-like methyltransferase